MNKLIKIFKHPIRLFSSNNKPSISFKFIIGYKRFSHNWKFYKQPLTIGEIYSLPSDIQPGFSVTSLPLNCFHPTASSTDKYAQVLAEDVTLYDRDAYSCRIFTPIQFLSVNELLDKCTGVFHCPLTNVRRVLVRGRLHSETEPALILANGDRLWCYNGKVHRFGAHAMETIELNQYWEHGKLVDYVPLPPSN